MQRLVRRRGQRAWLTPILRQQLSQDAQAIRELLLDSTQLLIDLCDPLLSIVVRLPASGDRCPKSVEEAVQAGLEGVGKDGLRFGEHSGREARLLVLEDSPAAVDRLPVCDVNHVAPRDGRREFVADEMANVTQSYPHAARRADAYSRR